MPRERAVDWKCLSCTLINPVDSPDCAACLIPRNSRGKKRKHRSPCSDQESWNKMGTVISSLNEAISDKPFWACSHCSYHNGLSSAACEMCHATRSRSVSSAPASSIPRPTPDVPPKWSCDQCTFLNTPTVSQCEVCGHQKNSDRSIRDVEIPVLTNGSTQGTQSSPQQREETFSPRNIQRLHSANIASVRDHQEKEAQETWRNIITVCKSRNEKFVDDSFPPTEVSLGKLPEDMALKFRGIVWRRPKEIYGRSARGAKLELMKNPGPEDIEQGLLGNCWFLSALAVVSEVPEFLERIMVTKEMNEVGVYQIRLCIDGQWKIITVDDFLPCNPGSDRLAFSRAKRNQLWVPLVEKALAKECGGYAALIAGRTLEGLSVLTGAPCQGVALGGKSNEDGTVQAEHELDIAWARILSAKEAGYIMGCSCGSRSENPIPDETFDTVGLTPSHAYSLLDVQEINGGTRLVKLRNPWASFSWKGEWSHDSTRWTPGLRTLLLPEGKKPGIFWIPYHQFCIYFNNVEIAKVRRGRHELRLACYLNPHAKSGYVQAFRLIVTENQEIDLTLYQENFRHETVQKSGIVDLGFIILNEGTNQEGSNLKFETWSGRKIYSFVGTSHIFTPGCYLIVVTSFSHWGMGLGPNEVPKAIIALHSSSEVFMERFQAPQFLLADAVALTVKAVGKRHQSHGNFDAYSGIHSWYLQTGFCGQVVMLENHFSDRFLQVRTNCSDSTNVVSTRGSLEVTDAIPPLHRQIIVVLSQLEASSSYHVSHRLQYRVSRSAGLNDWARQILSFPGAELLQHVPELTDEVDGLHHPRPLIP